MQPANTLFSDKREVLTDQHVEQISRILHMKMQIVRMHICSQCGHLDLVDAPEVAEQMEARRRPRRGSRDPDELAEHWQPDAFKKQPIGGSRT